MIANIIGTGSFALSGFFVGIRNHLDIMGVFIVSLLTAAGGGILRDVMVGRVPVLFYDHIVFFTVAFIIAVSVMFRLSRHKFFDQKTWFVLTDSIGLVAFSVTGTLVAIDYELPIYGGIILAFLTATGGGILRDMLVNETPFVLKSDFYGSVAVIVAVVLYGLHAAGIWHDYIVGVIFIQALILRLIAHRYHWHLPKIKT